MVLSWKLVKEVKRGLLFLKVSGSVIQTNFLNKIFFIKLKISDELYTSKGKSEVTSLGEDVVN